MAVSTTNRKAGPFVGNDATTVFPFTFKVFDAEDVLVVLTDDVLVENTLVLDTDYTVILNGDQDDDPGGSVTLVDALETGTLLTITSQVAATQTVVLTSQGGFYPNVLNRAFDKLTIIVQQLAETVGRTIRLPLSSTASGELPNPQPNALLGWNGTGTGFSNVDITSLVTAGAYGTARVETFEGTGAQIDFDLANSPGTVANVLVFIGGVAQVPGVDFALVSARRIRFTEAPFDGAPIQVRYATGGAIPAVDDLVRSDGSNAEAAAFRDAIGAVASADLADDTGAGLVGLLRGGIGAVFETLAAWVGNRPLDARSFGAVANGVTDDGPAIRLALTAGLLVGRPVELPNTGLPVIVGADPAAPLAGGFRTYSLLIPTGTRLKTNGATIKAANGVQSWNRIVNFQNQSNIQIEGVLRIDANAANRGVSVNEHMHGVFFFDSTDIRIPDGIDSQNAVGDNVYIGGTGNTVGTTRVFIGDVYCKTAGRKNFVSQASRDVFVGDCVFDNISGGSAVGGAADGTECHSLDIEPDAFTGATPNDITFGNIVTYGSGNDFTAGTTATQGDNWTVHAKSLRSYVTPRAGVRAWEQNAITLNIPRIHVSGLTGVDALSQILYAARINCDDFRFEGARPSDNILLIATVGSDRPLMRFGDLQITNTAAAGTGLEAQDASVRAMRFVPRTVANGFYNRGLSSTAGIFAEASFGEIHLLDTGDPLGSSYALLTATSGGNTPFFHAGLISHRDTRGTKIARVLYAGPAASPGIHVEQYQSMSDVPLLAWDGPDRYYKTGPLRWVGQGTPEAMITSGIGGLCQRIDGGAATSLYVKESGTGNTGWAAK